MPGCKGYPAEVDYNTTKRVGKTPISSLSLCREAVLISEVSLYRNSLQWRQGCTQFISFCILLYFQFTVAGAAGQAGWGVPAVAAGTVATAPTTGPGAARPHCLATGGGAALGSISTRTRRNAGLSVRELKNFNLCTSIVRTASLQGTTEECVPKCVLHSEVQLLVTLCVNSPLK